MDATLVALQNRIYDIDRELEVTARIERLQHELATAQAERQALVRNHQDNIQTEKKEEDTKGGPLPEPLWEGIYLCVECNGEVLEGLCCFCGKEHAEPPDADDELAYIDRDVLSSSRYPAPRGTTPPRRTAAVAPPDWFNGSADAYAELLHRGATPAMVERFRMEWNPAKGIRAYPTGVLFDDWAGTAMRHGGSSWSVQLGREINLDDSDTDGSRWFADLLDDVLNPLSLTSELWVTVEERADAWVTRPKPLDELDYSDSDLDADGESAMAEDDENENENQKEQLDEDVDAGQDEDESGSPESIDYESEDVILQDDDYESEFSCDSGDDDAKLQEMLYTQEDLDSDGTQTAWGSDDSDVDMPVVAQAGMDVDSECTDSDQPGSDWDSNEELSGDEEIMALAYPAWAARRASERAAQRAVLANQVPTNNSA